MLRQAADEPRNEVESHVYGTSESKRNSASRGEKQDESCLPVATEIAGGKIVGDSQLSGAITAKGMSGRIQL